MMIMMKTTIITHNNTSKYMIILKIIKLEVNVMHNVSYIEHSSFWLQRSYVRFSGAPLLSKFGNLSSQEILVAT